MIFPWGDIEKAFPETQLGNVTCTLYLNQFYSTQKLDEHIQSSHSIDSVLFFPIYSFIYLLFQGLVLGLMSFFSFEFDFYFKVTWLFCESISLVLGFATAEIVVFNYLSEVIYITPKTQVLCISLPNLELNGTKAILKFNSFLDHDFAEEKVFFYKLGMMECLFRKNFMNLGTKENE